MTKVFLLYFSSFFIYFFSLKTVDFINNFESEKILDKKVSRIIVSTLTSLFVVCLFFKYGFSFLGIKFFLLSIYLIICAYIDHYSHYVYSIFSAIFFIISISILVYQYYTGISFMSNILSFFLTLIICYSLYLFKVFSWGDIEVFSLTALCLGNFLGVFIIFLSLCLSGIFGYFKLLFKRIKFHDRMALCPFIAVSTIIVILLV